MSSAGTKKNSKIWRIWSMFLKEIRMIRNDKFALLLVFALPGMIMGTMYFAINQGSIGVVISGDTGKSADALVLGVVDLDPTDTFPNEDLSESFILYLDENPNFIIIQYELEEDALEALYQDILAAYAVIPYGFEGNITGDIPAFVDIHISSTNFQSQATVFSEFQSVVESFRSDHGWIKGEVVSERVGEFEPEGDRMAASFGVFLLVFSVFVAVASTAAQAIVGDVPLNRMLLTPATKMEAILAKTLAYFAIGMVQSVFLIYLWKILFGIVPNTGDETLFLIMGLMSISGAALGVLISTMVTTRLQANQSFLFLLFGSMIVGTGFIDVGIFDELYPLNLGRVMVIDTAFKGITIWNFTREMMLILGLTVVLILIAWLIFSKKQSLA
ncbi:MAG: ABC transporter permease [Candidatus Thorarchaeota archaeon]